MFSARQERSSWISCAKRSCCRGLWSVRRLTATVCTPSSRPLYTCAACCRRHYIIVAVPLLLRHKHAPIATAGLQGGARLAIGAGPNFMQRAVRPPQDVYLGLLQVALLPRRARHRRAQAACHSSVQAHAAHRLRGAAVTAAARHAGSAFRHRRAPRMQAIPGHLLHSGVVPGTVLKWGCLVRVALRQGARLGCLRQP